MDLGTGTIDLSPRLNDEPEGPEDPEPAAEDRPAEVAEGEAPAVQPFDIKSAWLDRVYFGPEEYLENVRLWLVRAEGGWDRMEIDGQVPEILARHPKAPPPPEPRAKSSAFGGRFGEAPEERYEDGFDGYGAGDCDGNLPF